MKIFYPSLSTQSLTRGIGSYTRELIKSLEKDYSHDIFYSSEYKQGVKKDPDLIHFPYFDPYFLTLPSRTNVPVVVTIHDLIPLKYPTHFPAGMRGKLKLFIQKKRLQHITHLITDSQASKSDIIKYLAFPDEKISVIPLAATSSRSTATLTKEIKDKYNLPDRYLLYVGDINWNKNVPGLIRAFSKLDNPRLHLVLVGKVFSDKPDIPEYHLVKQAIEDCTRPDKIHALGYLPSHHLPYIYQHATLYVQPSFDEGFGLPLLEAMQYGCPVISSNQGSLPEVGGEAAVYFDPHDHEQFVSQLAGLLKSASKRDRFRKRGIEHSKQFSWKKTAELTHEVYEKIIQS